MRVLVTGAAGFIGSHVVRALIDAGHEPLGGFRPGHRSPPARLAGQPGSLLVPLDLDDAAAVRATLAVHRPDAIVHLAWYAVPGRYRVAVAENAASLAATATLLLAAQEAGCPRVVLAGSCVEQLAPGPRPMYDAAKVAAHAIADGFVDAGLSVACGHVFYLYGPAEDERRLVPSVIRATLANRSIATGAGDTTRDYLHVADVASGFVALASSDTVGRVEICSGRAVALSELLGLIGEETGRSHLIRIGERPEDHTPSYTDAGDPRRLMALGWSPRFDLRDGIRDTIAWWTARPEVSVP